MVGIEASSLFGQRSGVGYYVKYLADGLAQLSRMEREFRETGILLLNHRPAEGSCGLPCSNRWYFPVKPVWFQFCLPRVARQLKFDLLHFPNYMAPLQWEKPYVLTVHDPSLLHNPDWHPASRRLMLGNLVQRSARKADLVLCVSSSVKEDIVERLGISPSRVRVTPLAAGEHFKPASPEQIFAAQKKYRLPSEYVLYVGNIELRKNLQRLVLAWETVCSRGSREIPLVLVGRTAWLYQEILRVIGASPHSAQIYRTGYVAEEDLPALYSGARLFAYPSLFEGFGLPVLEAMACGVPVLASDIKPLREMAEDAAFLVAPTDRDALGEGLRTLLEDETVRSSLCQRGFQVVSRYSWGKTARQTLAAYREVLEGCRRTSKGAARKSFVSVPQRPSLLSEEEFAILRTVLYSSLFQYPLTLRELHRGLLESAQGESSILEGYRRSTALQSALDFRHGYFSLRGGDELPEKRRRRQAASQSILKANRRLLTLICTIPYTRMVALSGSAAHLNLDGAGDVDLLIITRGKRVWSVVLTTLIFTKLLRRRKLVCVNFVLSDDRLRMGRQDLFNANQMIHLKPLIGYDLYRRFLVENPFVFSFYPNSAESESIPIESRLSVFLRSLKRLLELLLAPGLGQFQEAICRATYSRYLRAKSKSWETPDEVVMEADYLKLHTRSHRRSVMCRFEEAIAGTLKRMEQRRR